MSHWPAQHTTVAIGHQLMALFAVQTSDFQAEIWRQQQQKQDIAKRKRMMASKSRYLFELSFMTSMTALHSYISIKRIRNWFKSIADFNCYKPDSPVKAATPLHHQDMQCRHTHSMLCTMSFESEVEGLSSDLMSWRRKVIVVKGTAYVVLAGKLCFCTQHVLPLTPSPCCVRQRKTQEEEEVVQETENSDKDDEDDRPVFKRRSKPKFMF